MQYEKIQSSLVDVQEELYVSQTSLDWFKEAFAAEVEEFCSTNDIPFNILLLLNNAPGHSLLLKSENPNVIVQFLPPNTP